MVDEARRELTPVVVLPVAVVCVVAVGAVERVVMVHEECLLLLLVAFI